MIRHVLVRASVWISFFIPLFTAAQNVPPSAERVPAVESMPSAPAPADSSVKGTLSKTNVVEQWEQELLRDPFWPVGFFPVDWKKEKTPEGGADLEGSGWKSASALLRISGTSRLGDRTVAIVNGELKSDGDQIEVLYEGKTYQWQILKIDADGQIQLKKTGIK